MHHDITTLQYEKNQISEVRCHHVFEHFTRFVACALLAVWSWWINEGGIIHVETPDFDGTCNNMLKKD